MAIRLLQTDNIRLQSFTGDVIPDYSILSHTWENEELSFQEMIAVETDHEHPATKKSGYRKVIDTCRKAREDGIAYVWIDTCCIDKTSSSELSEAINSMYKWYRGANVCYVFLADFDAGAAEFEADFPRCRWFTRGWCLQELLAPSNVQFFDKHWNYIGSKTVLKSVISSITKIPELVLAYGIDDSISVAQKMSWAAKRETTRVEDIAYSLLGIFDVNMPMLYGEGPKAFLRLQEEIIFRSNDRSIFAFLHESPDSTNKYSKLFATSPKDFSMCSHVEPITSFARYVSVEMSFIDHGEAFALTNKGLYFRRVKLFVEHKHGLFSLPLNCTFDQSQEARIMLQKVGPGLFSKVGNTSFDKAQDLTVDVKNSYPIVEEEIYIINTVTQFLHVVLNQADRYAIHVQSCSHTISRAIQAIQRATSSDRWDVSRMLFLTSGERPVRAHWKVFPHLARRIVGSDTSIMDTYRTTFYLVAGIEDSFDDQYYPHAWVRIYSLKEWRDLENKYGIITSLDDIAGHQENASTSYRMETPYMAVTANIRLNTTAKLPHFVLTLDLDTDFRA